MKRVLVGGLHHESDTFNPILTGPSDIWVLRGDEILKQKGQSSITGIVTTLMEAGYEVVPTLLARAVPNGEWDRTHYEKLKEELMAAVRSAGKLDAICLSLHGSMRVHGLGEAEGDLLSSIRTVYPDIPLFSSLDMHATMTEAMVRNVNGFVGYKCAPHTDTLETGIHAAKMTIRTLEEGLKPRMAAYKIPVLIAGEQSETSVEPMLSFMTHVRNLEKKQGIMAASILLGFPWADVPENGVTALVVTEESQEQADDEAITLARRFWDIRKDFHFYNDTREPREALDGALEYIGKGMWPVVISDSGDNPTAGSSQDVTNFLKMILADSRLTSLDPPVVYQGFYDPAVCRQALQAGSGAVISCRLGAAFDTRTSTPLVVDATVKATVASWPDAHNADLALLDVGGVDVVVTSAHVGCYDPDMMRALGVEPEKRKLIIVKLGYLEPEIRAIARSSIMALTDGSSNEIFTRLPYRNLPEPMFPFVQDFPCNPVRL
ncbi:M81 family metallopeptidase [Parasphaerochaeta coccoides]|uniref:Microcystin LR degradation protein MlrC n=1 Tax=Parasphaerochaeta coccoides (strain ATCC BAA-1237 / DSM 17374 / SPN1) TaxID=760011 RepID=F4GLW4_PARC1|nr:M81 family metallopeptidase [Parasphaerochaeta coccoides]AEC03005.1 Microcystin LR degradation protein MlrC [Parasphaerochaeta coccoides DSM 17374]